MQPPRPQGRCTRGAEGAEGSPGRWTSALARRWAPGGRATEEAGLGRRQILLSALVPLHAQWHLPRGLELVRAASGHGQRRFLHLPPLGRTEMGAGSKSIFLRSLFKPHLPSLPPTQ